MTDDARDALAERIRSSTIAALDLLAIHAGDRLGWYAALAARRAVDGGRAGGRHGHERPLRARVARAPGGRRRARGRRRLRRARRSAATRSPPATPRRCSTATRSPSRPRWRGSWPRSAGLLPDVPGRLPDRRRRCRGGPHRRARGPGRRQPPAVPARARRRSGCRRCPDVHERLSAPGARVADVACGGGWSSIAHRAGVPGRRGSTATTSTRPSIDLARANAAASGVADRVTFHVPRRGAARRRRRLRPRGRASRRSTTWRGRSRRSPRCGRWPAAAAPCWSWTSAPRTTFDAPGDDDRAPLLRLQPVLVPAGRDGARRRAPPPAP